jgi:hypothetical protein
VGIHISAGRPSAYRVRYRQRIDMGALGGSPFRFEQLSDFVQRHFAHGVAVERRALREMAVGEDVRQTLRSPSLPCWSDPCW